ncbi:DUF523 domain-containing protein [Clostridium arbusti]|uniref:DUF523 domain-containing protein n=1 Tax=Clostridium arbusti TaxID=1137848 RepID=UPI0003169628|nr:DUF523 domain-containing protein [Clostridium arbusti]
MYLISACLCGVNCKYSGENNLNEKALKLFNQNEAILVCPEVLGGLSTPRAPQEILGGTGEDVINGTAKVISEDGQDSTKEFIKGAELVLDIAKRCSVDKAILKAKSPSCGCREIYDGSFSGKKIVGNGVTAELLIKNNIKVYSEEEI